MSLIKRRVPILLTGLFLGIVVASMFYRNHQAQKAAQPDSWGKTTEVHRSIIRRAKWVNAKEKLDANTFVDKNLLLYFWEKECTACWKNLTLLTKLKSEFSDVVFIGVLSTKPFAGLMPRPLERQLEQSDVKGQDRYLVRLDPGYHLSRRFGVDKEKSYMLVNKMGRVVSAYPQAASIQQLQAAISELMDK